MNDDLLVALTIVAALGAGMMAGAFFVFSTFVMGGLARIPAAQAITAMQSINIQAVRPPFMALLFIPAALAVVLAVVALIDQGEPESPWLLAGGLCYLVTSLAVTAVFNVPRNNALAAADPDSAEGAAYWRTYLREWVVWNHLRTAGCLAAAALLTVGLVEA